MKKVVLATAIFALMSGLTDAFAQNFKFDKTSHDFGTVKAGKDTLWTDFKFTNDGSEPLMISDVKTSCDCTLAKWPKAAIQPGQTAVIKGGFKIEGKSDSFKKYIIISANTMPGITQLTLTGLIVPNP